MGNSCMDHLNRSRGSSAVLYLSVVEKEKLGSLAREGAQISCFIVSDPGGSVFFVCEFGPKRSWGAAGGSRDELKQRQSSVTEVRRGNDTQAHFQILNLSLSFLCWRSSNQSMKRMPPRRSRPRARVMRDLG